MIYKTVKILKVEKYRSKPLVNMTDNYVRVTITCSRNEWQELRRHLLSEQVVEADAESPHLFKYCGVVEHPDGANYCYKCGGALRTA